jgi:uncharacterized protein (DUF952 family)
LIYHFCPRSDWEAVTGSYEAPSLATQGFIHLSAKDGVHIPANLLAHGRKDLVVLEIDESRLPVQPIWEDGDPPAPDGRQFPHLYGPIPVTAVVAVIPFLPAEDGTFAPLA